MSVIEGISPIKFNDVAVGYLMFGQILEEDHRDVYEKANIVNSTYGISISNQMIESMTIANDEMISSAVNMMTMCAEYLYTNEIIKKDANLLADRIKAFVSNNLSSDLCAESVCRRFYISRTKLYRLSSTSFGMGFSDYVREQRIKEAKKLLRSTEQPISAIAEMVGISDANYFIRMFKLQEGITPLKYRKLAPK
jgi:AraC-like DNA-binding protein